MNSLSQGIFTFPNGVFGKKPKEKKSKYSIPKTTFDLGKHSRLWNAEFERTWNLVQKKVDELQDNNNDNHLADLFDFIAKSYSKDVTAETDVDGVSYLRVATLLTGINKPDHHQYFKLLASKMSKQKVARSVFLPARDCPNIRIAMETLVACLMANGHKHLYYGDDEGADDSHNTTFAANESMDSVHDTANEDDEGDEPPIKLRRSQYTLNVLKSWYEEKFGDDSNEMRPKLAIIMPNFEEFKPSVIKDLISILSNHCYELPFVVILGVATSTVSVLNTFSFAETSRIKLRAFSPQPPNQFLEEILDEVLLTPKFPFQLASNVFDYLKGVFIFYDLTTKNFLKALHHCLLQHYLHGNAYSICATTFAQAKANIAQLKHDDLEMIRRLPSFRPYVESMTNYAAVISIFQNDEFFRKTLINMVRDIYSYQLKFHGFVRMLFILVKDLPKSPLGKRFSDVFSFCNSTQHCVTTTEDFKKCWQLLTMTSKNEFVVLLRNSCKALNDYIDTYCDEAEIDGQISLEAKKCFKETINQLNSFIDELLAEVNVEEKILQSCGQQMFESRQEFYRNLMEQKQARPKSSEIMDKALEFLRDDVFGKYLMSHKRGTLMELFVYSDCDWLRSHLRGTSRCAIHTALTNPHNYLQCNCCCIANDSQSLLPSMPDISVAYKLLLESGQQVNIYDWMVAFNTVVGNRDDESDEIPPVVQAKFTRGRAELQFLGFTKSSKRKTDHVTRTTW